MNISPADLEFQATRALRLWPWIPQVEKAHGLPPFMLLAVGSRETNLDPKFTEGATGDHGHGHGIWQLDDRYHAIAPGFDMDPFAQAGMAADMLSRLLDDTGNEIAALNAYNSGSTLTQNTTGRDYGPDVHARRIWLVHNFDERRSSPMVIVYNSQGAGFLLMSAGARVLLTAEDKGRLVEAGVPETQGAMSDGFLAAIPIL